MTNCNIWWCNTCFTTPFLISLLVLAYITCLWFTLYLWLQFQCTQIETSIEYGRSHNEHTKFLSCLETSGVLSHGCIKAIVNLQNQLRKLESKLAAYNRMNIERCMNVCTTLLAECWNFVIKHIMKWNSRVNIDNTFQKMCIGTDDCIQCRHHKAKREMYKQSTASCAPMVGYINRYG